MSVKIISDSTCDLSPELVQRYGITILPLHVLLGDDEYLDGVNITPEQIYAWSDEHRQTPKTSAISIPEVMKACEEALETADELVIFTISESMSVCYNNCRMAAGELNVKDRVHVIDSANLSTGIGLLVIEAAIMAQEGHDAAYIENEILKLRPLVRASFVVDTLVYLYRGGRCSGLAAMVGGVMKLHPRIAVTDGAMGPGRKYRGLPSKYVMEYVRDMEPDILRARKARVFITHSGCDDKVVATVRSYLEGLSRFDEILITRAGSVVSSHCGPGTLGVLFILEEK